MRNSSDEALLRKANLRLCRLRLWSSYDGGLGFVLDKSSGPPYIVKIVESNSPAAAGGLKFHDIILAVNSQDVTANDYNEVKWALKAAQENNNVELLVIDKRYYDYLIEKHVLFDSTFAKTIDTPQRMPRDYKSFPKHTPRTCEIQLSSTDQSLGFDITHGDNNVGVWIQEVQPNTPASGTLLRKCDRILEINDDFVDDEPIETIKQKLKAAKSNRYLKLYVVDTAMYRYFKKNKILLKRTNIEECSFMKQKQESSKQNEEEISVNSSTTSIYEDIAVFDDRLEKTLNSQGQYARLGSSGKFYCGGTLDGSKCSCCNGECGPMDGCNCSSCMLLDVQKRALPQG
ncbi:unnamed protein product [Rotaria sp. Silwood1]|nr:unnamed protein product [Rotaria sp. Silwood1]CAF4892436.1 unnamed protein product [Rotaria sp. Silwood1]